MDRRMNAEEQLVVKVRALSGSYRRACCLASGRKACRCVGTGKVTLGHAGEKVFGHQPRSMLCLAHHTTSECSVEVGQKATPLSIKAS